MGIFDWQAAGSGAKPESAETEKGNGILAPLWWIFFPLSGGLTGLVWVVYELHTGEIPFRSVVNTWYRLRRFQVGRVGKTERSLV